MQYLQSRPTTLYIFIYIHIYINTHSVHPHGYIYIYEGSLYNHLGWPNE